MSSREGARSSPAVHDRSTSSEIDPPSLQERQPTHRTTFLSADNIVTSFHNNPTNPSGLVNIGAVATFLGQTLSTQLMRPFEQLPQQQQDERNAFPNQARPALNQRHSLVARPTNTTQTYTLNQVNNQQQQQHHHHDQSSRDDEFEGRHGNQHHRAHHFQHNNHHHQNNHHRHHHHHHLHHHHHHNGQQQQQQRQNQPQQGTSTGSTPTQTPTLPSIYIELRDFYQGGHRQVPAREAVRLLESLRSPDKKEMDDEQYSIDVTTETMTSTKSMDRSSQAAPISKTRSDQLHSVDVRDSSTDGPHSLPDISRLRTNHGSCVNKILGAVDPDVILKVLEENQDLDFVFLSPILPPSHPNYSPYLMHVVVPEGIDLLNYCMVSRQHVIRYTRGHHPSIQSLERWRFEQKVMHQMRALPFFQNFRIIKAFNGLAMGVGMHPTIRTGRRLRSKLLTCDPVLADTLVLGRTMCLDMADLIMVNIDWELTYSLSEFIEEQSMFLRERSSRLDRYLTILMHLTLSTCWDDVISAGMAVEVGQRGRPTPRRTNEIRKKDREKKSKEDGGGSSQTQSTVGKGRWNEGLEDNDDRVQRCARLARFVYLIDCLISDTMNTIGQNSLQRVEELLSVQKSSFPSSDEIKGIVKSFYGHLRKKPTRKGNSEGSDDSNSGDDDDDDGGDDDDNDDDKSSDSFDSQEKEEDDDDDGTLKSDGSSGKDDSIEKRRPKRKRVVGKKKGKKSQGNKSKNDPEYLYGKSITIKDSCGIPQQLHIIGISPVHQQNQQQQQHSQKLQSQNSSSCGYFGKHRFRTDATTFEITDSNAVTPPVILTLGTSVATVTTTSSGITTDSTLDAGSAPAAKPPARTSTLPTPQSHSAQPTTTTADILAPASTEADKTKTNNVVTSENTSTSSSLQSSTSSSFSVLDFLSARGILFRDYGHLNDLGGTVGHEGDQPPFHPLDNIFHVPERPNRVNVETTTHGDDPNNFDNIVVDDSDSLTNENDNSDAGAIGNSLNVSGRVNDVISRAEKGATVSSHSDSSTMGTDTGRVRSSETLTAVAATAKVTAATFIYPSSTSSAEEESQLSSAATISASLIRASESTATDDVIDGLERIRARGITARIDVHRYSPTISRSTLSGSPLSPQEGRWLASLPSSMQPLLSSTPSPKLGAGRKSGSPPALFANSDPPKHPSAQTMTSDMTSLYSSIDNNTTNAGNSHTSEWEGSPEDSNSHDSLNLKTSSSIDHTCAFESPERLKNCEDNHKTKKNNDRAGQLNKNAKPRLHVAWKNEELEEIITSDPNEQNASSYHAVNNTSDECDENFEDNNNDDDNDNDNDDDNDDIEPWLKKFIEKMPAVSRDKIYPFLDKKCGQANCLQWHDKVLFKGQEASSYLKSKIKLAFGQLWPPTTNQNAAKQGSNTTRTHDISDTDDFLNTSTLEFSCVEANIYTTRHRSINDGTQEIDTSDADTTLSANSNILKSLIEKTDNNGNNKDKSKRGSGTLKSAKPNLCQMSPKKSVQHSPDIKRSLTSPKTVTVSVTISDNVDSPPQRPRKERENDSSNVSFSHSADVDACLGDGAAIQSNAPDGSIDVERESQSEIDWEELWANNVKGEFTNANGHAIDPVNKGAECNNANLSIHLNDHLILKAYIGDLDNVQTPTCCEHKDGKGGAQRVEGDDVQESTKIGGADTKCQQSALKDSARNVEIPTETSRKKIRFKEVEEKDTIFIDTEVTESGSKISQKEEKEWMFKENDEKKIEVPDSGLRNARSNGDKNVKISFHDGEEILVKCDKQEMLKACDFDRDTTGNEVGTHENEVDKREKVNEMKMKMKSNRDRISKFEREAFLADFKKKEVTFEDDGDVKTKRYNKEQEGVVGFVEEVTEKLENTAKNNARVKDIDKGNVILKHIDKIGLIFKETTFKGIGAKVKDIDGKKTTLKHIDKMDSMLRDVEKKNFNDISEEKKIVEDNSVRKTVLKHIDNIESIIKGVGKERIKSNDAAENNAVIEHINGRKSVLKNIDEVETLFKEIVVKKTRFKDFDIKERNSKSSDDRNDTCISLGEKDGAVASDVDCKETKLSDNDNDDDDDDDEDDDDDDDKENKEENDNNEEEDDDDEDGDDDDDDNDDECENDVEQKNDDDCGDDIDNKADDLESESRIIQIGFLDTSEETEERDRSISISLKERKSILSLESSTFSALESDIFSFNESVKLHTEYGTLKWVAKESDTVSSNESVKVHAEKTTHKKVGAESDTVSSNESVKVHSGKRTQKKDGAESDTVSSNESVKVHAEKRTHKKDGAESDTVSSNESVKVHAEKRTHKKVAKESDAVSSYERIKMRPEKGTHKKVAKESDAVSLNESVKVRAEKGTHKKVAKESDAVSLIESVKVRAEKGTHKKIAKGSDTFSSNERNKLPAKNRTQKRVAKGSGKGKDKSPSKSSGTGHEKTSGRRKGATEDRHNTSTDEDGAEYSSAADDGDDGGGSGQPSPLARRTLKPAFHISLVQENHKTYLVPDVYDFVAMAYTVMRDIEKTLESFTTLTESAPFQTFINSSTTQTSNGTSREVKGPSLEYRFSWNFNVICLKNNIYDHLDGMFHLMAIFTKEMNKLYRQFFRARAFKRPVNDKDIRFFATALKRLDSQTKILERLPDCQRVGMFLVDLSLYRDTLKHLASYEKDGVHKDVNQEISGRTHMLIMRVLDVKEVLESQPLVTDCQFRLLSFIDHADFLMNEMEKKDVPVIAAMYDVIDRYGVPHEESTREEFESCHSSFDNVKTLQEKLKGERREEVVRTLEYNLSRDEAWIESQVNKVIRPLVRSPCLHDGSTNWTTIERVLAKAEMVTVDLVAKANFVRRVQRYLKKQESQFTELFRATDSYTNLRNAWLLLKDWDTKVIEWKTMEFVQLNVSRLNFLVFQYMEACRKLASRLPPNTVLQVLEDKMDLMLRWLNFIIEFRSPVIKQRHWLQIQDMLGVEFGVNLPLTLGNLMSIKAIEKQKALHMVLNRARVENNVQSDFDEVIRQCNALVIPIQSKERTLVPGESAVKTYQLADSMELEEALNYLLMELERIDMSPQAGFLHETIERQVHRIFEVLEVLVIWTEFTIKLARIRRLILRNPNFVQSIPQDVARYKAMYNDHSELLARMRSNPLAFEWCTTREVNEFLQNNHDLGTSLIRSLRHAQEEERQGADPEERSEDDSLGAWVVN